MYKPYPKYKESGVAWLGEVPEGWEVLHIKRLCFVKRGASPRPIENPIYFDENGEYAWVRISDVTSSDMYLEKTVQKLSALGKSLSVPLEPNDLFLSIAGSVGKPMIANIKCCIHDGFVYFQRYKENLKFLYWVFKSGQPYLGLGKFGTQLNLNKDTVGDIKIGLPPLTQQTQIANYLNQKTKKIDTLIEKQQTLIELLQEKRQALISHVVTKGLDDSVPMKESGVAWLGEVPEHWKTPKIKWFSQTDSGGTPTSTKRQEYYINGIYPWVRTTDLNNGELLSTPIKITEKALNDTACNLIPKDSVLIGMYGGAGTIGKHSLLRFESTINQAVCAITPNETVNIEFLHYIIQYYRPFWMIGAMGTRKDPNIGQETIRDRKFSIPPLKEQTQIANYLDEKTKKIDTLIEKSKKSITLLKERRQHSSRLWLLGKWM